MNAKVVLAVSVSVLFVRSALLAAQSVDLPSSKQLVGEIPGHPQRLNSLPMSMAVSPNGRYVVTVNAGFGTFESKYEQSLAVLDTQTGMLADFPDERTVARLGKQTLYSGVAFSRGGKHIYASMASLTDPLGGSKDAVGSGVVVYSFSEG
ncbi:MAG: phosphoesterase, partial [Acidobacteriaceae bacterium]|nr:phosphoesterase [Acidobacteriaceae bacterium]